MSILEQLVHYCLNTVKNYLKYNFIKLFEILNLDNQIWRIVIELNRLGGRTNPC